MKTPSSETSRLETRLRSAFGLKTIPFAKDLEPEQAFRTDTFDRALERLGYLADRQGMGAVFGTPGTGKSTLMRTFLSSLPRAGYSICYLAHSSCATLDLFRDVARGFQIVPRWRKADVMHDIQERLVKLSRTQKIRPLLVIDDAHLLPCSSLDEIRLLTSFEQDSRDDLTVILVGHPQLESNLRLAVNEALAQRLVVRLHLRPLRAEEVADYLVFRLERAGRSARLFLPDAVEAVHRASRGIPRRIDRIAEHALLAALKAKRNDIDAELVTEAMEEVEP